MAEDIYCRACVRLHVKEVKKKDLFPVPKQREAKRAEIEEKKVNVLADIGGRNGHLLFCPSLPAIRRLKRQSVPPRARHVALLMVVVRGVHVCPTPLYR